MSEQEKRIVNILELSQREGMPWYAENYINGKELEEREKNGTLTEAHRNELVVLGRELGARQEARVLARKIGDQEWSRGNTKYALEAYEAACVAPSEILEKAEALLEAESLVLNWGNEIKNFIEGPVRVEQCKTYKTRNLGNYANVLNGVFYYCPTDDCSFCSDKKVLNRKYANKIQDILKWDFEEPKEESARLGSAVEREAGTSKCISDRFAGYFLGDIETKYRAAAVAALKLVNRLERIYITKEPDIEPIASHSGIAYTK